MGLFDKLKNMLEGGHHRRPTREGGDRHRGDRHEEHYGNEWGDSRRQLSQKPGSISRVLCQKCGATNQPGARFCQRCGTAFPVAGRSATACAKCGARVSATAAFCDRCGQPR